MEHTNINTNININIEEKKYEYWLASIVNLSHMKKRRLVECVMDIRDIYNIEALKKYPMLMLSDEEIGILKQAKKEWNLLEEYDKCNEKNIKLVTWKDENYPNRLRPYRDAPYALFYKGELPEEDKKTVAIVGARRCSHYGETYACEYGRILAENGVQVLSGLAKGIDGLAQRAAIQAGGNSFGVLGSGIDICYPREHIGLYQDLCKQGGILSELPIGVPPIGRNFPLRNRIISGLSDIILVIEAKERSGSLITADLALEQGKEVYALPGQVDSELSKGCNWLIKQGAGLLNNSEEFMNEMGINTRKNKINCVENKIMLESKEKLVYSCLRVQSQHIDCILNQVEIPIQEVINILVSLELKGYIKEVSKNHYVKLI